MKLAASYGQMSDVPAGYEDAYSEVEGKVVFTGGDFEFKNEADIASMKTAKDHANNELSEIKTKLKSFEGIEPDKYKALVEENEVLKARSKNGGNDEETIKAIVDMRVARQTESLTKENSELREANNKLESFRVQSEKTTLLNDALSKNVSETARSDAEFILGSIMERQADGSFLSNGNGGFDKGLSVDQVLSQAIESRPHWKKKNVAGSGARGASGGTAKSNATRLREMIEKNKKGELSRREQLEMNQLAAQVKTERQQGN